MDKNKWRAGITVGYEYIQELRQKLKPDLSAYGLYLDPKINVKYHLIKGGAIFEYDLWQKGGHSLGLSAEFGYFTIVKANVSRPYSKPPFLYGSIGTRGTYLLGKSVRLVYGIGLNIEGNDRATFVTGEPVRANEMVFQPRHTIGIRTDLIVHTMRSKK